MKERYFIEKSKQQNQLQEFISESYGLARVGLINVHKTPVGTRITIHTSSPGLIIGAGGERIRELSDIIRTKFGIENPQIDVQKIKNPDLDPIIVAKNLASAIESGVNFKRLGNTSAYRIMNAGAIGCEVVFAGKFSGQRGKIARFNEGYLKKCGDVTNTHVLKATAIANPRLGNVSVTVKIMIKKPGVVVSSGNLKTMVDVEEAKNKPKKKPSAKKVKKGTKSGKKNVKKKTKVVKGALKKGASLKKESDNKKKVVKKKIVRKSDKKD